MSRALGCASICAAMITAPLCICADLKVSNDSKQIILVADEENVGQMRKLAKVSASHIQDLNATVFVQTVSWDSENTQADWKLIRGMILSNRAFLGVWLKKSDNDTSLFLADATSLKKVSVRPFKNGPGEWEVECETIAVLIRSALISRLELSSKKQKNEAVVSVQKKSVPKKNYKSSREAASPDFRKKSVSVSKQKPVAKKKSASVSKQKPLKKTKRGSRKTSGSRLLGRFDLGFAAAFIHKDESWTYNAHIGAALLVLETISIGVSTQIGSSPPLDISGTKIVLRHFPIFATVGIVHGFGKWEPGAAMSFVTDVMYLDNVSGRGKIDGTTRALFGMRVSGKIGYRVFPFLAVVAFFGGDFFFKTSRYIYQQTPVLRYGAAQAFVGVGVELFTKRKKS